MTKKREVKSNPAGKDEKLTITYTGFATNLEKSEMLVQEGKQFDNDALLELLGFEKDGNGGMKLPTEAHNCEVLAKGKKIRRDNSGNILTGKELVEDIVR